MAAQEFAPRSSRLPPARCSSRICECALAAADDQLSVASRAAGATAPRPPGPPDLECSPPQAVDGARRRAKGAHRALELRRGPRPVQPRLALVDLARVRGADAGCGCGLRAPPATDLASASTIISAPSSASRSCSVPASSSAAMATRRLRSTGPVSSPASICMIEMPVSAIAREHRALDRRRAAPARQQRGVNVERAVRGRSRAAPAAESARRRRPPGRPGAPPARARLRLRAEVRG